ncbi:MAG: hypothetical protein D6797_00685 [Bdellovibrio sp.]|nr:MAG: hypothetical protein D6797_00685 [Bdellovibrio sp.]
MAKFAKAKSGKEFKKSFIVFGVILFLLAIVELIEFQEWVGVVIIGSEVIASFRDALLIALFLLTTLFLRWFYNKYVGPIEKLRKR